MATPDAFATHPRTAAGALGEATSLARVLDFTDDQPRHFGAPPATSRAFVVGGFNGEVARGASCNCRTIALVPHCNGTHTESVAHLVAEAHDVSAVAPLAPLPALLLDVSPVDRARTRETADPPPREGDRLVTAEAIDDAWRSLPATRHGDAPVVLVLRTGDDPAAYLTLEAAQLLVERGIEHVVLELPSMDRAEDEGRLGAHRRFFGLPAGSIALAEARRAHCTITELAHVPSALAAGPCLVQLQLAPWTGDAVPSRPVHYRGSPP